MSAPEESVSPLGPAAGPTARVREESFALRSASAEEIVEQFGDLVYSLAVRLTRDRDEARDLAQEAFLKILKGAPGFRGEASPKTWVCQVVINCHRNQTRFWRRRRASPLERLWQKVFDIALSTSPFERASSTVFAARVARSS